MGDLIERIGIPMFVQIIIESWNEIFLLLLIVVMQISKYQDKSDELASLQARSKYHLQVSL